MGKRMRRAWSPSKRLPEGEHRSIENSGDSNGAALAQRVDPSCWNGTAPEYLAYLSRCPPGPMNPTKVSDKVSRHKPKLEQRCIDQLRNPGRDGLDLSMFPQAQLSAVEPACHPRDSSSNYSHNAIAAAETTNSPPRDHHLGLTGLEKYSCGNDCLSNLRSSSGSLDSGGNSVHGVAEDTATAAQGWDEQRALSKSSDGNKVDEWAGETALQKSAARGSHPLRDAQKIPLGNVRPVSPASQSIRPSSDDPESRALMQCDGAHESNRKHRLGTRDTTAEGTEWSGESGIQPSYKRKSSHFSLRSLSNSLSNKRPRLHLRGLATAVRDGFSQVGRRLRNRRQAECRSFESWKASRRRDRPGDALKGKTEVGFGTFNFERSLHGHESWWRDGVCKYEAPRWMVFGGGGEEASTSSRTTQIHHYQ